MADSNRGSGRKKIETGPQRESSVPGTTDKNLSGRRMGGSVRDVSHSIQDGKVKRY